MSLAQELNLKDHNKVFDGFLRRCSEAQARKIQYPSTWYEESSREGWHLRE